MTKAYLWRHEEDIVQYRLILVMNHIRSYSGPKMIWTLKSLLKMSDAL